MCTKEIWDKKNLGEKNMGKKICISKTELVYFNKFTNCSTAVRKYQRHRRRNGRVRPTFHISFPRLSKVTKHKKPNVASQRDALVFPESEAANWPARKIPYLFHKQPRYPKARSQPRTKRHFNTRRKYKTTRCQSSAGFSKIFMNVSAIGVALRGINGPF